jgi:FkbM family methyltransferase
MKGRRLNHHFHMTALLRLYRGAKYSRITLRPGELAALSLHRELSPGRVERGVSGALVIPGTRVELLKPGRDFLLAGITLVDDLRRCAGGVFSTNSGGEVLLEVGGVKLLLTCWEELYIAHEVFFRGCYNLHRSQRFHLVDVGMNTGTTSLFFAANPLCERVDAFELFPPTAVRATRNFELNPALQVKIHVTAAGLAAREESAELEYFPEFKGSVGMGGLPDYARPSNRVVAAQKVKVKIAAAVPAFEGLLSCAGALPLVCKLDCEGAEYGIVEALANAGLLGKLAVLMIEWHRQGVAPLERALAAAGFEWFAFDHHGPNHGMIYAWRADAAAVR